MLLAVYRAALASLDSAARVRAALIADPLVGAVHLLALGKAAPAMAAGAAAALGTRLRSGLVVTKRGHADVSLPKSVRVLESDHPVPGAASLEAGAAALGFLEALPPREPLLVLISGGTSSLVESLPDGWVLADLRALNEWLLGSGLDIHAMNAVRRRVSRIKGGRLLAAAGTRPVRQYLVSDVPGDRPASVGSGPFVATPPAPLPELPEPWRTRLAALPDPAPPEGEALTAILASNRLARLAAIDAARRLGVEAIHHDADLGGPAAEAGQRLAREVLAHPGVLHVWGGETTVVLPEHPGRGGRCQTLALAAAEVLSGQEGACLLAAGTDGADGPGEDAGALVDAGTIARGREEGLDAADCLRRADAGRFLEASGDLVSTGPTGTNVMDLILGYAPRT